MSKSNDIDFSLFLLLLSFSLLSYWCSLILSFNCRNKMEYVNVCACVVQMLFPFSQKKGTTKHDKTFEIRYLIHYTKSNYISNMTNVYRLGSYFFSPLVACVTAIFGVTVVLCRLQYWFCCYLFASTIFVRTILRKIERSTRPLLISYCRCASDFQYFDVFQLLNR